MLGKPFRTGKAPYRCCRYRRKRHGRSPRNLTAVGGHVNVDFLARVKRLIRAQQSPEALVLDLDFTIDKIAQKERAFDGAFKGIVVKCARFPAANETFRSDHNVDRLV